MPDPHCSESGSFKDVTWTLCFFQSFVPVLSLKSMPIVMISESLLLRDGLKPGVILRDRVLCGFCLKVGARTKTFLVATSVRGKQFRCTLGRWPLLSVEEARDRAMVLLRDCRRGVVPERPEKVFKSLPTLAEVLPDYCAAKKLKESSCKRYDSFFRTHFAEWLKRPVDDLRQRSFAEHCHQFAQTKGAALVELGRGVMGAIIKYVNAVHGLDLTTPFTKLAAAGLMPERAKPRPRTLEISDLPTWKCAVDTLPEPQRDCLMLLLYTGLRRNECGGLTREQVDFEKGLLTIPMTKNGKPHSLPITPLMDAILRRRCNGLAVSQKLFKGVSVEHLAEMAMRAGAPKFMLHDLRKLHASAGNAQGVSEPALRALLNHTPPKRDTLNRHYIETPMPTMQQALEIIQSYLSAQCSLFG
ncbi:tyrosine-type recombinase/integrase [Comamonas jiangduensis]|uniref:tyrosine-type recombinase/integrase n=1 Tax=Comamonas jiangduensis TaxID=1194168 RepID=UPI003BF90844